MKYSYQWLQELSGTEATVSELVALLTMHAFEVEEVQTVGLESDRIVVGEVLAAEPHPNADKLRVAQVHVGTETLQIVCGAPDLAVGQKVAVALVGAILPGNPARHASEAEGKDASGFVIKQAVLRGVESNGMICSQRELGVGDPAPQDGSGRDHDGIWVLSSSAEVGSLVRDIVGSDSLLDIKVLPDRAHDCLSHVGMAREIAALEGRVMDFDYDGLQTTALPVATNFTVRIDAATGARRYIGVHLRLGKLGTSPAWLQSRLKTFGMRSIHPVVDVTNFVMLELGQPLHAFDWEKLLGKKEKNIEVRNAERGEQVMLLDDKEYALTEADVVIADGEKAIALAGVMGGKDSAVTEETSEILLEAACFDPVKIRRTRTRLGLRTDASDRFEKGLSADLVERALARAVEILEHLYQTNQNHSLSAGRPISLSVPDEPRPTRSSALIVNCQKNEAASDMAVDMAKIEKYPQPFQSQELVIQPAAIDALLGVRVEPSAMKACLQSLGFKIMEQGETWRVNVPMWRLDVDGVADLAEEVGRLLGYDVIPSRAPMTLLSTPKVDVLHKVTRDIQAWCAARGLSEVYRYSFYSEADALACGLETNAHLALANPMNPDQALMRTTLAVGLLQAVRENLKHMDRLAIFEVGHTYHRESKGTVVERRLVAGTLVPHRGEHPFFAAKDIVENLFASLGIQTEWETVERPEAMWHPTQTARVYAIVSGARILLGTVGVAHPKVLERLGVKRKDVALWECSLEAIVEALPKTRQAEPIRKFPTSLRDMAVFVPLGVTVDQIEREIRTAASALLLDVEAFDRYEERDAQRKLLRTSLAFHLTFGADDRTLSTQEVETETANILQALESRLGLELRR